MEYCIAPLYVRPWTLNGISARLIESHYEHNYGSALTRLNAVTDELERIDVKRTPAPVISRLKQEQTCSSIPLCCMTSISQASAAMDARRPR